MEVPSVLRGGNHAEIRRWRRREALKATYLYRPDLLAQSDLALDDGMLLLSVVKEKSGEKNG
jgi:tRNA (guanine37-N1)-methyltransferase